MEGFILLLLLLLGLGIYFFPVVVGGLRGVQRVMGIFVLNLFLGWTLLGWVGALVWAVSGDTHQDEERRLQAMRAGSDRKSA